MSEKPILFSAPMVQAILAGAKTVTRRVVKPPVVQTDAGRMLWDLSRAWPDNGYLHVPFAHPGDGWQKEPTDDTYDRVYPKWEVGDVLWVRETTWFRQSDGITAYADGNLKTHPTAIYGNKLIVCDKPCEPTWPANAKQFGFKCVPSIFMPRWASRITLEVVSVRPERLQEITEDDADSEGFDDGWLVRNQLPGDAKVYGFRETWAKINGKTHPWASNPWVWRVEFKPAPPTPARTPGE